MNIGKKGKREPEKSVVLIVLVSFGLSQLRPEEKKITTLNFTYAPSGL